MKTNLSDIEIIEGLQSANTLEKRKFEKYLFEKCIDWAKSTWLQKGLSHQDVEEVCNDAYIGVLQKILDNNFRQECSLKTFFYRIFSNKSIDFLRKNSTKPLTINLDEPIMLLSLKSQIIVTKYLEDIAAREIHKKALQALDEKCQKIITLRNDGLSHDEIAAELGLSNENTSKSKLNQKALNMKLATSSHFLALTFSSPVCFRKISNCCQKLSTKAKVT